jgi:hypothetical protein
MNLDRVTITGPDDSIGHPSNLLPLTEAFPFVEWGILVSESVGTDGGPRFPSAAWVRELTKLAEQTPLSLSMHLCGRWVRDLLLGNLSVPAYLTDGPWFQRIQLNFHAERTPCNGDKFFDALLSLGERQFIFQIDGAHGNRHLEAVYVENGGEHEHVIDAVPLFDVSGGAGILPREWPKPQYMNTDGDHCYHGYAGGLGPENLTEQLPLISDASGGTRIWIDMETRVRSDDDRQFDLAKVRRCLEASECWVSQALAQSAALPRSS